MPPPRKLVVARKADHDVADILQYTEQEFGEAQADVYERRLRRAMQRLLSYPALGTRQISNRPEILGISVEHHIVFYRVDDEFVTILRVLHVRQDFVGAFKSV